VNPSAIEVDDRRAAVGQRRERGFDRIGDGLRRRHAVEPAQPGARDADALALQAVRIEERRVVGRNVGQPCLAGPRQPSGTSPVAGSRPSDVRLWITLSAAAASLVERVDASEVLARELFRGQLAGGHIRLELGDGRLVVLRRDVVGCCKIGRRQCGKKDCAYGWRRRDGPPGKVGPLGELWHLRTVVTGR